MHTRTKSTFKKALMGPVSVGSRIDPEQMTDDTRTKYVHNGWVRRTPKGTFELTAVGAALLKGREPNFFDRLRDTVRRVFGI